jgi:hypothetical protein
MKPDPRRSNELWGVFYRADVVHYGASHALVAIYDNEEAAQAHVKYDDLHGYGLMYAKQIEVKGAFERS